MQEQEAGNKAFIIGHFTLSFSIIASFRFLLPRPALDSCTGTR